MKICMTCGSQLPDDALFCSECGTAVPPKTSAYTTNSATDNNDNNQGQANYTNSTGSAPYSSTGTYYVNPNRSYPGGTPNTASSSTTASPKRGNIAATIVLCILCPIVGIIYCAVAKPFNTEKKTTLCAILTGVWLVIYTVLLIMSTVFLPSIILNAMDYFYDDMTYYDDNFSEYNWIVQDDGTYTSNGLILYDLGVEQGGDGFYYLTGYLKNDSTDDYHELEIDFSLHDKDGYFVTTVCDYTDYLPQGETRKLYVSCGMQEFADSKPLIAKWSNSYYY